MPAMPGDVARLAVAAARGRAADAVDAVAAVAFAPPAQSWPRRLRPHDAGVADVARARSRRRRRRRRCRWCRCTRRRRRTASSPGGRCRRRRRCAPASRSSPPIGQEGGAHCVPAAYSWQAPAPSQKPVVPQVAAPSVGALALRIHAARRRPACRCPACRPARTTCSSRCRRSRSRRPGRRTRSGSRPGPRSWRRAAAGRTSRCCRRSGVAQSASAVQVDLQATTPHLNGKQELGGGVTHAPAPSQVDAGVSVIVLAGQLAAAQGVPCAYCWQAPAAHLPLVPQVPGLVDAGLRRGRGCWRARSCRTPSCRTARTTCRRSRRRSRSRRPARSCSRRTRPRPSRRRRSASCRTSCRRTRCRASSCASAVQLPKHLLPLQAKGTQAIASGATQVPVALQVDVGRVLVVLAVLGGADGARRGTRGSRPRRRTCRRCRRSTRAWSRTCSACRRRRSRPAVQRPEVDVQRAAAAGAGAGLVAADAVDAVVARALARGGAGLAVRLLAAAAVLAGVPGRRSRCRWRSG